MIDHTGASVSGRARSVACCRAALAPLGYQLLRQFPAAVTGGSDVAGFGVAPRADFWLDAGTPARPPIHAAALAAGGRDNGAPGRRPHYHPDYYRAFVLDFADHNIEVVTHEPIPASPGRP